MVKIRNMISDFDDADDSTDDGDDNDSHKDGGEKILSGMIERWIPGNFLQARIIAASYFRKLL